MGRKSSVAKLPEKVRSHIERALRDNRLSLDELIADLQKTFPAAEKPSRSALGRYRQQFDVMVERMREQENMGRMLVAELGENPDDKAGALMVQSLSILMNDVLSRSQEDRELAIDDVRKLARAAKDTIQARSASLKERQAIEAAAREKLLAEQEENLQNVARAQGMNAEQVQFWREKFLGIRQ